MGAPRDPITGVTAQQDHFARLVAAGATYADAYRQAYHTTTTAQPHTVYGEASTLASRPDVARRIQDIKAATEAAVIAASAWTAERFISEAETQLRIAREGGYRSVAAGNGALELIGRATGLLDHARDPSPVAITRVVVVLDHGDGHRAVATPGYRVLPPDETATNTGVSSDGKATSSTGTDNETRNDATESTSDVSETDGQ